jgi:hypothetical protein
MEAHELRIGNKVFNPNHNKVYTVDGFKYLKAPGLERRLYVSTAEMHEHSVFVSVLEPVTLTSDWLVNIGAKSIQGKTDQWSLGKFTLKKDGSDFMLSVCEGQWLKISSVHDLQNLYYYHHDKTDLDILKFF